MNISDLALIASEEDEDDEFLARGALLLSVLEGINAARLARASRRSQSRLYLRRAELMPEPRVDSPWQRLWISQSDRAFITTMGFDVQTFRDILEGPGRFGERWESITIPRGDVSSRGRPRLGARSLDAAGALGLVLHYYGSAMRETSLQQIFALVPTTVSRYLAFAKEALLNTLRSMDDAEIRMPEDLAEYQAYSELISERHPELYGAFGTIDGLSLPLEVSDDPEMEHATYNGWKANHCVNNVLVFAPTGVVINAVLNCPGSWHDSHVARPIFHDLYWITPTGFYLVADTAFPRGDRSINGKIRAPLKTNDNIAAATPSEVSRILAFDRVLVSYRQSVEWGMRTIQGSFPRLRVPLPIEPVEDRQCILETCVRLLNVRAKRVGISQIRSVYNPIWRASEDEQLWNNLGQLMFSEIRSRDRVSQFHLSIVQT